MCLPPDGASIRRRRCAVKVAYPQVGSAGRAGDGHQLRVRHDHPHLGPYTPKGAVSRSAIELASDVQGLRLALTSALSDRYRVRVSDDGSTIGQAAVTA